MKTFHMIVSTPEGKLFEGEAVKLFLRGAAGDLAVLANHIPFITSVKPCDCRIELEDGTEKTFSVTDGLLNVSEKEVILLSSNAE